MPLSHKTMPPPLELVISRDGSVPCHAKQPESFSSNGTLVSLVANLFNTCVFLVMVTATTHGTHCGHESEKKFGLIAFLALVAQLLSGIKCGGAVVQANLQAGGDICTGVALAARYHHTHTYTQCQHTV